MSGRLDGNLRHSFEAGICSDDSDSIENALNGVKIEVTHKKEKMQYRVSGLTSLPSSQITFPIGNTRRTIKLVKYYKETYGIDIKYTHLPCVQVGSTERTTYFPMEVCHIVKGQRYSKSLNASQVTELRLDTCKHPQMRQDDIIADF
ncbi:hypothetical protein CASFOL_036752 [Castilleja foliolosa]|uniref:PAZ domain-containing protein n=1 Tax=Castilleja foliolosa TaxID=1961234 RepID=A0ABD3BPJ2_9LAMI